MEWVEQIQRDLGGQFTAFLAGNWPLLAFVGLLAVLWLYRSSTGGQVYAGGDLVFDDSDHGSDEDGDGGGDGGGD